MFLRGVIKIVDDTLSHRFWLFVPRRLYIIYFLFCVIFGDFLGEFVIYCFEIKPKLLSFLKTL
jgi:hypothetical protein